MLDCRKVPGVGKYLMFFHGSGPKKEIEGDFDRNASIGIAWSDDLEHWDWPRGRSLGLKLAGNETSEVSGQKSQPCVRQQSR